MTEPQVYGFIPCEDAEFPPEMMVGETVYDFESRAVGWIVLPELFTDDSKLREQIERERQTSRARLESIDMLKAENAKLRELALGLGQCAQGVGCEDCLLYDLSEPDHCREERLSRELGIEVDG